MEILLGSLRLWFYSAFVAVFFWSVGLRAVSLVRHRIRVVTGTSALTAILLNCALGYVAFWLYLLHWTVGALFSAGVFAFGVQALFREQRAQWLPVLTRHERVALVFAFTLAVFYQTVNLSWKPLDSGVANSSLHLHDHLPHDNEIPYRLADKLARGENPRDMGAGWKSSDRPFLQSGIYLVLGGPFWLLRPPILAYEYVGIFLQSLWVVALFAFLTSTRVAVAVAAACASTGFVYVNTVYIWPKLFGASLFAVGAYFLFQSERRKADYLAGFAALAFSWLSHGGAAFGILALALVSLLRPFAWNLRWTLLGAAVFAGICLPWTLYQKFFDPPGDKLLRMHFTADVDPEGSVTDKLVKNYRALPPGDFARIRSINWQHLWPRAHWVPWHWKIPQGDKAWRLRADSFGRIFATPGWFLLAAIFALWPPLWRRNRRVGQRALWALAFTAVGLGLWIGMMFHPFSTSIHQGFYIFPLLLVAIPAWLLAETCLKGVWILFTLQALASFQLWVLYGQTPVATSGLVFIALNAGLLATLLFKLRPKLRDSAGLGS